MKIITITHSKGGVGKSLTAYQIIEYLDRLGHDYLAIDCDIDNRTISTINDHMRISFPRLNVKMATSGGKLKQLISHAKDCEYIIIDTGGNSNEITQEAIRLSDKIITPISNDAITEAVGFTRFKSVLKYCGTPKIHATFCNVNSKTSNFANMKHILDSYENIAYLNNGIKTRSIYKQALAKGLGVYALSPTNNKSYNSRLAKAQLEVIDFVEEVMKG